MNTYNKKAILTLKLGIAFVFTYAAISGLVHPAVYVNYFPGPIRGLIPEPYLTNIFSGFEIVLVLWLLLDKKSVIPASIMSILLIGIVLANLDLISVLFRNVGIISATLALVILQFEQNQASKIPPLPAPPVQ